MRNQNHAERVRLPSAREIEMIIPMIREQFMKAGFDNIEFDRCQGLATIVAMNDDTKNRIVSRLFAFGIVMVNIGIDTWGFAVRD